jgi:hypothetical protein
MISRLRDTVRDEEDAASMAPQKKRKYMSEQDQFSKAVLDCEQMERKDFTDQDPLVEDWWATPWGIMLKDARLHDTDSYQHKQFARRFRLPFDMFTTLVGCCTAAKIFDSDANASGHPAMPVEIKVLGALRTLGRGTLHDEVAELSQGDWQTHRSAFLAFIKFVAANVRDEKISVPKGDEFDELLRSDGLRRKWIKSIITLIHNYKQ